MLVVVYDDSPCKKLGIYGHNMVAAWWSNLMPQNYATRTGEASCELQELQQAPQSISRTKNCFQVKIQPENRASKVLEATES